MPDRRSAIRWNARGGSDAETTDWRYVLCPLPVVRKEYVEERDDYRSIVEVCGEHLYVEQDSGESLLAHGPSLDGGDCGVTWKVSCGNGHVVIVPDHEGDDSFSRIPFDWSMVREQLDCLGATYRDVNARA